MNKHKSPFLNELRHHMHARNYSEATIKSYVSWALKYIVFNHKKHPRDMGREQVEQYLAHLATARYCSVATQKQALNALAYLYNRFLIKPLGTLTIKKARKPKRLPTVLSVSEVNALLENLTGVYLTCALLMYGGGLRLMECLRLRIKDIDFERKQITVRGGKGDKDRTTMLAPVCHQTPAAPTGTGRQIPPAGSGQQQSQRVATECTGAQIPKRTCTMGLAMAVPRQRLLQ
jgi:site-specific recombinase XerD